MYCVIILQSRTANRNINKPIYIITPVSYNYWCQVPLSDSEVDGSGAKYDIMMLYLYIVFDIENGCPSVLYLWLLSEHETIMHQL